MKLFAFALLLGGAAYLVSQDAPPTTTGPQTDGSVMLNSGWRLRPAGQQIPLDTFPMSTAMTPDGKFLLVLHCGYRPPSIAVFDAKTLKEVARVPVVDAWLGLTLSPDGKKVYVGGGAKASVFEFTLAEDGQLSPARTFVVVPEASRQHQDFVGDVTVSPDGRLLYAAILHRDMIAVINPLSGMIIERIRTGRRPYRILFHPDGQSFFVSSWADAAVFRHKAETGERLATIRVGPHPTDMVWSGRRPTVEEGEKPEWQARLFVAAANTNNVYVIGLNDGGGAQVVETLSVALSPRQPAGMTPSALALNSDQTRLYTVCSDANAVAVADISGPRTSVLGFIPTGWYPTAARVLPGGRVFITNGKGSGSFPNPNGPQPGKQILVSHEGIRNPGYVGNLQRGTASVVAADGIATEVVIGNSPYRDQLLDQARASNAVVPGNTASKSPIQHVIYVVKENRTYDQVLGDLGVGNGDPSLTLFTEDSTPNHRKLARDFVLLDNFYVNADVSADGHNWSTAAIAPDYVMKLWPSTYSQRRRHYDYEGGEPAALPPAGRLWNSALAKGLSIRNYGWWVDNKAKAAPTGEVQIDGVRDPVLAPVTNAKFRGFDLDYLDVERAKIFAEDVVQFDREGKMPSLMMIRLGNDHTSGTSPGKYSPTAAMADNDLALGMIVEAVSKTRFWRSTAIFVLQDDAQNGPDHVDSHRSPAFVVSPYSLGRGIDSTFYNTAAMLRTMELILGLSPMTHFDAGAMPMAPAFRNTAREGTYTAVQPKQSIEERNPGTAPGAAKSARMNFEEADEIDDDELNEILWRAIRKTEPPPPMRSIFGR